MNRFARQPERALATTALARIGILFIGLMAGNPGSAAETACPGIHVTILGIRNGAGTVDCALFESSKGFPVDVLRSAMRLVAMKVPNTEARCDFENIPAGTYALVILHDENMNGKLDTNWLGVPREGYGFSRDAKAAFAAPSFSDASFEYNGETLGLTITLRY
jgi:uncharacterized protein (DUF2141 family)